MIKISTKDLIFLIFIVVSLTVVGAFGGGVGIYGVFIGVIIGTALTKYSVKKTAEKMLAELINPKRPEENGKKPEGTSVG